MASRADLPEAFFFVACGLALAAAVSLITYFSLARSAEPACGRCGYLSKGAASFTCPECGSDLREVGIVRQRDTRCAFVIATIAGLAVGGVTIVVGGWLSL